MTQLVITHKASEVFAPLIRLAKEHYETGNLAMMLEIFVVRMPLALGGGILGATWTESMAHGLIESIKKDTYWKTEMDFHKAMGLDPVEDFIIEKTFLGALNLIGE